MIIAIDGPSGAGKSTIGKMLARHFDLLYIDTGAMYRTVALAASRAGLKPDDREAVSELARRSEIALIGRPDELLVELDGEDVTAAIRAPEITNTASIVSTIPGVRRVLVEKQRELARLSPRGAVLDGRDIGSVVFPDADIKFFLTADADSRARRRMQEESGRGRTAAFEEVLAEINERDLRDRSRADSPLMLAEDAILIDTSDMDREAVFERLRDEVARKIGMAT